jgi:hypothetical protein
MPATGTRCAGPFTVELQPLLYGVGPKSASVAATSNGSSKVASSVMS